MDGRNRRQEPRFAISQMVELGFGKERWINARGIDISRTGFRGLLSQEIDPGTVIYVMFRIEDEQVPLEAIAVHIHEDAAGMFETGFQFTSVEPGAERIIETYIASLRE